MSTAVLSLLAVFLTNVFAVRYVDVELPSSRLYSLWTELCCNGTIHENTNLMNDYECCGPKLIDKKTEICCYPEIYPRLENTQCCGKQTYNKLTHQCVVGTQYRSRSEWSFLMANRVILPIEAKDSCGDRGLNYDEEICCDYEIFSNPDKKLDCCKSTTYEFSTTVCCGDTVVPKNNPEDNKCCGTEPYNWDTHACKNGVLIDKPKSGSSCGGVPVDSSKELCCMSYSPMFVLTKSELDHNDCCGDQSYSSANSVCCMNWIKDGETENKLHSKTDVRDKKCCGTELIDSSHDCCRGESFDPQTHTCCFLMVPFVSKIVEKANALCCGIEAMDPEKEECCGTTIIAKSPEGKSGCCIHKLEEN